MRIDFARPGGQWAQEMVPGAGDYQRWDANAAKLVSGDLGGTYAPTSPIVIGGGGIYSGAGYASGGVSTATGGRVIIQASANDFPQLNPPRVRTIRVPLLGNLVAPADSPVACVIKWETDDVSGFGAVVTSAPGLLCYAQIEIPGRYIHAGARLASFELDFVVRQKPTALPTNPIQLIWFGSDNTGAATNFTWPGLASTLFWSISHSIALTSSSGIWWVPSTALVATGLYYSCTAAGSGTIGSTEPTWPTTIGASTTPDSNGVVWTAIGRSGQMPMAGRTINSYYNNGASQKIGLDTYGTADPSLPTLLTNIMSTAQRYAILFDQVDSSMLLTGLTLSFDSITSMAFT